MLVSGRRAFSSVASNLWNDIVRIFDVCYSTPNSFERQLKSFYFTVCLFVRFATWWLPAPLTRQLWISLRNTVSLVLITFHCNSWKICNCHKYISGKLPVGRDSNEVQRCQKHNIPESGWTLYKPVDSSASIRRKVEKLPIVLSRYPLWGRNKGGTYEWTVT